jgi:hypothetical protein
MRIEWLKYLWWPLSVLIGGAVGLFFAFQHFLVTPIPVLVAVMTPLKGIFVDTALSAQSEKTLVLAFASFILAIPKVLLTGVVLGALASKLRYPRTLFYSVFVVPLVFLMLELWTALRFEHYARATADENMAWAASYSWNTLMPKMFFFISTSALFALVAFLSHLVTMKMMERRRRLATAKSLDKPS